MIKRATPPGIGAKKNRGSSSEYKKSLMEKQSLKKWYGLSERQFKKYVLNALSKMGKVDDVSNELIRHLEKRLDNAVYRMGYADTRAKARQLVNHGFFTINGKPVDIPSYQVKKNDVIALKETKKKKPVFKDLQEQLKKSETPAWLVMDKQKLEGKSIGEPNVDEVKPPAEISLIFEFYSR
jgi:small subunit ribosomal protein S4